ncbi:MAG TPA: AsmA-like C-terminal region-containing protein [Planctomycetota bacterium]|nr:AsmA-like C-terminal region-containing protein [Planctomycetota bacterium]
MRLKPPKKVIRVIVIFLGAIIALFLVVTLFLALGGGKFVIEAALPAAMNGYITVDRLTYIPFGTARVKNLEMVLDWHGRQERVIAAKEVVATPRILPLLRRRMQFDKVVVKGVELNLRLMPTGLVNIDQLFRKPGMPKKPFIQIYPPAYSEVSDVAFSFRPFTYAPIQIDEIAFSFLPRASPAVQLFGYGKLKGELIGTGNALVYVDVLPRDFLVVYEGGEIELSYDMLQKLPLPPTVNVNEMILPSGRVRFSAIISGREDVADFTHIQAELADVTVASLQYPVAITNASGRIVSDGRTVSVRDFRCLLSLADAAATMQINGQIHEDGGQVFDVSLENVRVTNDVLAFLPGSEISNYLMLNGDAGLKGSVYNRPGWSVPRVALDFSFHGQLMPLDYPVPVQAVRASIRTEPRGTIVIDRLETDIGEGPARSRITAGGTIDPARNLVELFFSSPVIEIDNMMLSRVPQLPSWLLNMIGISGRLSLNGEFAHSADDNVIDARVGLNDFDAAMLQYPEIGFKNLTGSVQFSRKRLQLTGLRARALTGQVQLDAELSLAPDNGYFIGDVEARDMDISLLPRELIKKDVAGILASSIHFEGEQLAVPRIKAHGTIAIRDGRLIELPVLISIINFLNLRLPGRVIFRSAFVRFTIENEVVHVQRLEMNSDVLTVYARGSIGLDGKLKLRVGVGYRRPVLRRIPLIGPIVSSITSAIRRALTTVDVTGTVQEPTITLVSAKYLVSPFTSLYKLFAEESE